jgi:hypothetical protein
VDVLRSAKLIFASSALSRIFGTIFFLSLLAGCFASRSPAVVTATISFTELTRAIAQMRGLEPKQDIKLEMSDANTATPDRALNGWDGPWDIVQVGRAYERVGLLPENTDFARAVADYWRLERIVHYQTQTATVMIRPEASSLGRAFSETDPRSAAEVPGVFGIVRALQEQHFHWQERMKSIALGDRQLAFRALATGDATLIALSRVHNNKIDFSSAATAQTLSRLAAVLEKSASHLPDLLRWKLVFPYREGGQFVSWAQANKGWAGVNALYNSPPLSTSQILHPEKYYVRQENPLRIDAWGLARQMKESPVVEQTLGEYLVRLLLSAARSAKEAERIASGWQGDLLRAYKEGNSLATIWISSWKTDKEANEFFRAYLDVLEKAHRIRFQASANQNGSIQAEVTGGRSMLLQVKGAAVLLLDGLTSARSVGIAQDIWRDLETEKESTEIPFESARSFGQLASRRR